MLMDISDIEVATLFSMVSRCCRNRIAAAL